MTIHQWVLAGAVAGALTALAATPSLADQDVSHNWNSDNEAEAMRVFRDKYVSMGGVWKDTSFPDSEPNISSVKTRFIGGSPPMAMQSSLGGVMREFAEGGLLQDMNAVAREGGWAGRLSAGMAETGKVDGVWVAAPVFVDVINWMYANNEVLAAAGVAAPDSWEAFKASLPKIQAAGFTPLAVGGQSWQEAVLFDQVVLAVGGAALYDRILSGDAEALNSDALRTAIEEMGALRAFTDEGKSGRSWNDTNTLLLSGKAAYFFMGPWAAGGYGDMGPEGERWSCRLTPWDDGLTVVADGFQFIRVDDEADKAAQALFANAVMDPQTQIAAAKAKGTLPVTNQADPSEFEGCPAKAVAAMADGEAATHWNGRRIEVGNAIKDNISAYWNGAIDAETAQRNLVAALAR